jgi:hypothetical protein
MFAGLNGFSAISPDQDTRNRSVDDITLALECLMQLSKAFDLMSQIFVYTDS